MLPGSRYLRRAKNALAYIYISISAQQLPQESVAIVQLGNGLALTDSALGLAISTGSATDGRACSEESAGKSSGPL